MPTSELTAKLFELEDAIITNFSSNNEEIHIEFQLKRKTLSCPHCNTLTDRIRIVRYVTWALENVRKRVQKQMHPSKRKYFKRS